MDFPTTITPAWIASIPGVMAIVWIVMTVVRQGVAAPWFNQWAPAIAVALGTILGALFSVVFPGEGQKVTAGLIVLGGVGGMIGGFLSQNLNNVVQRARGNSPTPTTVATSSPGGG